MAVPVTLPYLGAEDEEIRVSTWLVDPGEEVEAGDRIVEVRIRGMTFDVPAPVAGTLTSVERPIESVVVPGDTLGWIEERAEEYGE